MSGWSCYLDKGLNLPVKLVTVSPGGDDVHIQAQKGFFKHQVIKAVNIGKQRSKGVASIFIKQSFIQSRDSLCLNETDFYQAKISRTIFK